MKKYDCKNCAKVYTSKTIEKYFETQEWENLIEDPVSELLARKPKEGEEDPVLVEEIRKARENVGMYTRKTSFEYEELDPIRFEKHKTKEDYDHDLRCFTVNTSDTLLQNIE